MGCSVELVDFYFVYFFGSIGVVNFLVVYDVNFDVEVVLLFFVVVAVNWFIFYGLGGELCSLKDICVNFVVKLNGVLLMIGGVIFWM